MLAARRPARAGARPDAVYQMWRPVASPGARLPAQKKHTLRYSGESVLQDLLYSYDACLLSGLRASPAAAAAGQPYPFFPPSLLSRRPHARVIFNFSRIRSLIMAMNSLLVGFPLVLLTV